MQRPEPDLYKHDDIINEQLARYGVKFGIIKIKFLKSSFFLLMPFPESFPPRNLLS